MPPATYAFADQKAVGDAGAARLDDYFSRRYQIRPVPLEVDRTGIDRIFTDPHTQVETTVEYKTDKTAGATGNIFVEIVSQFWPRNRRPMVKGWAYTAAATWLIIYVPGRNQAFVIETATVRDTVGAWRKHCRLSPPDLEQAGLLRVWGPCPHLPFPKILPGGGHAAPVVPRLTSGGRYAILDLRFTGRPTQRRSPCANQHRNLLRNKPALYWPKSTTTPVLPTPNATSRWAG